MPWTANVLGWNLSRTCFFSNGKFSVSNQIVGQLFVYLFVFGLVVIHGIVFFAARIFL